MLGRVATLLALAPGLAAAQTQWFTPSDFDLTCVITQVCVVGDPCTVATGFLTIRHATNERGTLFDLPDGTTSQGAIAILAGKDGQSLIASASDDGRTIYRIVVYPSGRVTIMQSHGPKPERDRIYYGDCTEKVSSVLAPERGSNL
ncbi:MAG: hypothetical protein AAF393_03060 [Pseudomonadota bacterium]